MLRGVRAPSGGKSSLGSDSVGEGTVRGGESDSESGGVSGTLCKAGRSEVMKPRSAERGCDESTAGGHAIVRTRWDNICQERGLASCVSCMGTPSIMKSVGSWRAPSETGNGTICGDGSEVRCMRTLSWVRGSPLKIGGSIWGIIPPKPKPRVVGEGGATACLTHKSPSWSGENPACSVPAL